MANEEIVQSWKRSADDSSDAPANPAGDALKDGDLESASGGAMTTEGAFTLGCCTLSTQQSD